MASVLIKNLLANDCFAVGGKKDAMKLFAGEISEKICAKVLPWQLISAIHNPSDDTSVVTIVWIRVQRVIMNSTAACLPKVWIAARPFASWPAATCRRDGWRGLRGFDEETRVSVGAGARLTLCWQDR